MLVFSSISILLICILILIIVYYISLYYANSFILYRNRCGILTAPTDQINRSLTFREYFSILKNIYNNTI
uniref:Uncharacterized protein n=1 Tax=Faxonius propinquus nudivirus TaxID=3139431 RepID=A0AAU8GD19_9VIRU